MPETLDDFIKRRVAELDEQDAPLTKQREDLASQLAVVDELLGLNAAERAKLMKAADAAGVVIAEYKPHPVQLSEIVASIRRRRVSERTIKEAVLETLREHGPKTALEILALINEKLGADYPRTSLSPQLSRLKADNQITRDGILWSVVTSDERSADDLSEPSAASAAGLFE